MLVSQFLRLARKRLGDNPTSPALRTWSDKDLIDLANTVIASFFRDRVNANENYHNCTVNLLRTNARKVFEGIYEYDIPSFVYTITEVRERGAAGSPLADPMQRWCDWTERPVARAWKLQSTRMLWVTGDPVDITFECTKVPAKLISGVTDVAAPGISDMILPADATAAYDQELEPAMFTNAVIQITNAPQAGLINIGEQRVVISTTRQQSAATTDYRTRLQFSRPWPAALPSGTSFESVIEIEEAHLRLLLFAVVSDACGTTDNVAGIAVLRDELKVERTKFEQFCKPRDDSGPAHFTVLGDSLPSRFDPDRDTGNW